MQDLEDIEATTDARVDAGDEADLLDRIDDLDRDLERLDRKVDRLSTRVARAA